MLTEEIFDKYFNKSKLNHAYLLKTNDQNKAIQIAKKIFSYGNHDDNINELIEENVYSDLKIIKPDGQWIKKEQIIDLQSEYKVKSVYDGKRIYIIANAENLNKSSGNTLLKFLEEPNEDIIALLITENKNKVLDTIVSRCEYISIDSNNDDNHDNYEEALELCLLLEKNKKMFNIDLNHKLEECTDRLLIKELFQKMITIYEQCLLKQYNAHQYLTIEEDVFDKIYKNNTIDSIIKKMQSLMFAVDILDYNVNLKLLVDKLLILMFGVE